MLIPTRPPTIHPRAEANRKLLWKHTTNDEDWGIVWSSKSNLMALWAWALRFLWIMFPLRLHSSHVLLLFHTTGTESTSGIGQFRSGCQKNWKWLEEDGVCMQNRRIGWSCYDERCESELAYVYIGIRPLCFWMCVVAIDENPSVSFIVFAFLMFLIMILCFSWFE